MKKVVQKALCLSVVVCFVALVGQVDVYAAAPTVKIVVSPNQTEILAGSDAIALTAQTTGSNLEYTWMLEGPGELSGSNLPGVFYTPPKTISDDSKAALITVVVKNTETGEEVTESMTFNISPAVVEPDGKSDVESEPEGEKKGMSRTTKIAIGAGAAALIGGGIALAAGGDDEEKEPFTGTFNGSLISGTTQRGNAYTLMYKFNLEQDGKSITGTLVKNANLVGCCTAVATAPVTGSVESDTSANLSIGSGEASCECTQWIWTTYIRANSGHVTLINGDKTMRFDEGAEYNRAKLISLDDGTEIEVVDSIIGDFVRE